MDRNRKLAPGATLLEIMLVLAIAAMIIVMSVRYYQSSTSSQQANAFLNQVQSITSAADSLASEQSEYTSVVSTSTVQPLMPNNSLTTSWGTSITVTNATGSTYEVTAPSMPDAVCSQVKTRLSTDTHYDVSSNSCSGTSDFKYTYNKTA